MNHVSGIIERIHSKIILQMRYSIAVAILAALSFQVPAYSQDRPTPTPAQLSALESLSETERQQLLEQFGDDSQSVQQMQPLDFPELVAPNQRNTDEDPEASLGEPRVFGGETLVVAFSIDDEIARSRLDETPILSQLVGTRTYTLSDDGELILSGIADIPLAGLTASEIELRLGAEPAISDFSVSVSILPLEPTGVGALEYFGYDLFDGVPSTFAPATDIPITSDYLVGPGDEIRVEYFGTENQSQSVYVSRDGDINLSGLGLLSVAGMTFENVRQEIIQRVNDQMIGVRASVTLGELRSIRIFVLGDVNRPGSYTVSGLSTMTNALFLSGGVATTGSLRAIQLKRQGRVVGTLDLYDLLLQGDTRKDRRLSPGDVIFVPPVGDRVGVEGEVERPAFYELSSTTSAGEVIGLAGGLTPNAFAPSTRVERISPRGDKTIVDIDLSTPAGQKTTIQDGDILRVFPILERLDDSVELAGHVIRAGSYQHTDNMRIIDLIPSPTLLKTRADLGYVLVRREISEDGRIDVFSVDLEQALSDPTSRHNAALLPRDTVYVFPMGVSRGSRLSAILDDIDLQANGTDSRKVRIGGLVRSPGIYPLERGMRISDLIRAGGGFAESAFLKRAELTRYTIGDDGARITQIETVDLAAILGGDLFSDAELQAYDYLNIREIPDWRGQESVTLEGEVRFPGVYPVKRGETLSSLIERAGGLTDLAFVDGSVFTRELLRQREEDQIDVLVSRLEADLAAFSLQAVAADANAQQAFAVGQGLLAQLRSSEASGRLVIDLGLILEQSKTDISADITLKDGDRLIIPQVTQEVTVIGEVQYATSHIFDPSSDRDDYIARSGGYTNKADERRVYVVRANGAVVAGSGSRWLRRVGGTEIRPGDTIVVPLDTDRIAPLTLWSSVTQIIYNLAVAVAAVNSF